MSGHLDCSLKQGHEKTVSCLKRVVKGTDFVLNRAVRV